MIAAALLVPYLYHRLDDEIRRHVEQFLARHYPNLQIKVRTAMLVKGEGIAIRGLSISDPAAEGPDADLLSYDECFLACPTDLAELCRGEPRPSHVVIRRPTLRMTRRPDGTWSTAKLLPLPLLDVVPEIRIENGTIVLFDPTKKAARTFTLRDVNVTFSPLPASPGRPGSIYRQRVQGTAAGDYFHQVSFDGEVDPERPDLQLSGRIDGVEISPELQNILPEVEGCNYSALGSLRGRTEARFQVAYDPAAAEPWRFSVDGRLIGCRLSDGRLPRQVTEIHAAVHVDNRGFSIQDLKARCDQAVLSLSCSGGLTPASPMDIQGEIAKLPLDEELLAILPGKLQEEWQKIRPRGAVNARFRLHHDGRNWDPWVQIECRNLSFTHFLFPYELGHGNGTLELKDQRLQINLTTFSENHLVHIVGEVRNPFTGATGWLKVKCDEAPLDEKLFKALQPQAQSLARALDLKGAIAVEYEMSVDVPDGPLSQHLHLWANRCSLRFDQFPYAISNIRGELEMVNGKWQIRNLEGYNGESRVTGEGTFTESPKGSELMLRLDARNVPLEGELRDALPPGMRQVWKLLQPHGIIDLTANVHFIDRLNLLDVTVRAVPRSETCSLEPVHFPYRVDNVQGVFTYGSGRVTFDQVSAWHGPVKLAYNGMCSFQPDGGWQLRIDRLSVDRLRLDRQLLQALPAQLKKGLSELNATGPISLQGNILLAHGANPNEPTAAQWNLTAGLNRVGLDVGVRLENVFGNIGLSGWSDGTRFQMRGELALESLTFREHQFTQILGPFYIDDQEAMFGSWVARRDNHLLPRGRAESPLRPVTAKVFGGTVYGDGWTSISPQSRYSVQATLVDADLAVCDRELSGKDRNLHGRILGSAELHGFGRNPAAMGGHGSLHLRDANVYELPVMISLLKLLSVRAPDPNAFSKSDIDFKIEGEHVYLDKIDFTGDAISLLGKGEMNFQGDARMLFTAIVGRGDAAGPMLRNFFAGTSQQFLQIRVGGNIQNPEIRKEAFPAVNQALKNLQER